MNKEEFLKFAGESSDDFIEAVNRIMTSLGLSKRMNVGYEMKPEDAKRLYIYICALEQAAGIRGEK